MIAPFFIAFAPVTGRIEKTTIYSGAWIKNTTRYCMILNNAPRNDLNYLFEYLLD